jgi:hypothetical protein
MTILRPVRVESSQFVWIKESREFVAEISDFGKWFEFGRVYDDAIDEGLTIVSSRCPGQEIVFVINHEDHDADGDVLHWDLIPADLKQQQTVPFTVRIFND